MIQCKFYQKLKDTACKLKQLEPYTPCSNAVEKDTKEIEKRAGFKLLQSRAPKWLWEDCLELETYIRSNTAHDFYKLDRDVTKTVMPGETSDISYFWEWKSF